MKQIIRRIAPYCSILALVLILGASIRYFMQPVSFARYLLYVQIGSVLWFCASPFWLIKKEKQ